MLNQRFTERFEQLAEQYEHLPYRSSQYTGLHVENGLWKKWATSTLNLIKIVFGENSPHYQSFFSAYGHCDGMEHSVKSLGAIFYSAKDDYENGFAENFDLIISGEIFGDFIVLAKEALNNSNKDVAAVLAAAALEDALKKFAVSKGLDPQGQSISQVINLLKSKGHVSGPQVALLGSMPKIRNAALHANWDQVKEPDVSSVIGFVEQFLLTNFNG